MPFIIRSLVLLSVFFRVIYTNTKGVLNVTFYTVFIRKAAKKTLCNLHTFRMCSLPSHRPGMMLITWTLLKKAQHCLSGNEKICCAFLALFMGGSMLYMLITIIMHVHDPKISHFKVFLRKVDRYTCITSNWWNNNKTS